jgi:3-deoxy-D-manno-octulosonic-acid transferase
VFKNYTGIFAQSEDDKNKFISAGAQADIVKVMGNLKFDITSHNHSPVHPVNPSAGKIIIAGSTHKGEDEIILDAFRRLKQQHPDIKLLLAPRHLNRVQEVFNLSTNPPISLSTTLRSAGLDFTDHDVIILDTLGELGQMYSICDFAFIGGSFNNTGGKKGTGGHNPLEAVVFNKPVVSGSSVHNFRDIYAILGRTNAGRVVKTPQELFEYMNKLLSDNEFYRSACEDCATVFNDQQGALEFVISALPVPK